jgi:hypothetical protein
VNGKLDQEWKDCLWPVQEIVPSWLCIHFAPDLNKQCSLLKILPSLIESTNEKGIRGFDGEWEGSHPSSVPLDRHRQLQVRQSFINKDSTLHDAAG